MPDTERTRSAQITIHLSDFEFPPMQDVLVVGRKAPIGSHAARRMVDAISPDIYEVIPINEGAVESLVVRRRLLELMPKERLTALILEETTGLASETSVLKVRVEISLTISRRVDL